MAGIPHTLLFGLLVIHVLFAKCDARAEYEDYTINGWTVAVCPPSSFCDVDSSCVSHSYVDGCKCDPACVYFKDCCIDYHKQCRQNNIFNGSFAEAIEWVDANQFSCLIPRGNPTGNVKYMMVSVCSSLWTEATIKDKCEGPFSSEDALTSIPVTYLGSLTFKNIYCAVCSYKDVSRVIPWELDAICLSEDFSNLSNLSALQVGEVMNSCFTWRFLAPFYSATATRECQSVTVDTCEVNPENETLVLLSEACDSYYGTLFNGYYRNPHCYLCSQALTQNRSVEDINEELRYAECPPFTTSPSVVNPPPPFPSYPISVLFDFTSVAGIETYLPPSSEITCAANQILDPVSQSCFDLVCPVGYDVINGTCIRNSSSQLCSSKDQIPVYIDIQCDADAEAMGCVPRVSWANDIKTAMHEAHRDSLRNISLNNVESVNSSLSTCSQIISLSGYLLDSVGEAELRFDKLFPLEQGIHSPLNVTCNISRINVSIGCTDIDQLCPDNLLIDEPFNTTYDLEIGHMFINSDNMVYKAGDSLYELGYTKTSSALYAKTTSLRVCKQPDQAICSLVVLNISLFDDLGDGSIVYLPLNKTISSTEFYITSNESVQVCSNVLVDGYSAPAFLDFNPAQSILSTVGTCLSILALIATVIIYVKVIRLRETVCNPLIVSLCVTLILAQLLLLLSGLASFNSAGCQSVAMLGHFLWLAVFSHSTALAFDLYRRFGVLTTVGMTNDSTAILVRFLLFAWCTPLLVVIPSLGIYFSGAHIANFHLSYGNGTCWIGDGHANLYVFGIPVGALILVNVVLFVMVVIGLHQVRQNPVVKRNKKESNVSADLWIYIKMSTLLGFTWAFGFIAAFANVAALWYIFIILNSLQGVYIFIAFVCNKRVADLWKDSCSCFSHWPSFTDSSRSRSSSEGYTKKTTLKPGSVESML